MVRRVFRRPSIALATVALFVVALGGSSAAREPSHGFSTAFRLPATNGYSATVIAGADPEQGRSAVIVGLLGMHGGVSYSTTAAKVTETSIQASFGRIGEIDVHLVTTGGTTTERSGCGGKPVTIPAARWEGTIQIEGEEGFAEVDATGAKEAIEPILDLVCANERNEGTGGHAPGALMELRRRRGTESISLSVRKNKLVGPTRIEVEEAERRGSVQIDRSIAVVAPSSAFDFEIPPGRATVAPGEPFSGSLALTRRPGSAPRVSGNLKVELPGRRAVPILGPGSIRARLVRAVLNPAHPY